MNIMINAWTTPNNSVVTRLSPLIRSRGYGEPGYEAILFCPCILRHQNVIILVM